jgi:hypothetical protein
LIRFIRTEHLRRRIIIRFRRRTIIRLLPLITIRNERQAYKISRNILVLGDFF